MTTIKEKDIKYHLSPMSDWKNLEKEGGRKIIVKGKGVYFWDINKKQYLDGMAGLWCLNLGYSCKPVKDAITQQLKELPFYNAFFKTSNRPTARLSELLSKITPHGINHFFYGCSGSDANDTIFKLIRRYWSHLGKPKKKVIISRKNSYHGSTLFGAALGGMEAMHKLNDLKIPDITHIDQPYTFDAGKDYNDHQFGLDCARQLEKKILKLGADKVGAFIGEPIQGAGGVIIPPNSYWPEISRICKKYNVLLVSDEVICGFGRTGKWFGCENWSVAPDFITMAKGISSGYIPLSAVGVSEKIYKVLIKKSVEFSHGYTYSAHPVATSAGVATLEWMINNRILDKINKETAPYFHHKGKEMESHPLIGEVRFKGMLMAFELVKDKTTRKRFKDDIGSICRDICSENGLVMRACKHTMVLSPPLVITKAEINKMFVLIKKAFDATLLKSKKIK